ncbi:GAF domain-containing protein [Streptomyces phaeochromogenes]|uniref:GAF domain-containing protein n=1 Tax=Streptomyces phaeochromogenes TaxID=1923 RepID=UPI00278D54AA|nr:GAF domain-containing protein [Streptomyces phaeochromogenes]MDQ0952719.1 GAF domain-containing protein [Streptomyces phaeochromogenes]
MSEASEPPEPVEPIEPVESAEPSTPRGPLPLPRLLEAVLGVGADPELRATLQHIVDTAAELTDARHAALEATDPGHDGGDGGSGPTEFHTAEPPAAGQAAHSRLDVPVRVRDDAYGSLRLTGKRDGGPFTGEDEQLVRVLATQAGIAIGNARLYETARQRERWIEGAAAVTTALLTGETAADALMTVAERARMLADASAGVILQPTDEGGMEIVTASTLDDPGGLVGTTIAPGSAVLEQLLGGEPVFVDDSATDPRMTTQVRHRFGPSMLLPLQAGGRLIGTLALPRRRGDRPYTSVEQLLATQFASQAALALVLADAQQRRERLAVFEDRDRIARDLHDLVVQRLFATGMMLESTQRRTAEEQDAEVHAMLGRAVEELRSTVQEVRTAIFALQQPPADAPTTFRGKVLRETAGAAAALGFQPSVQFTGPVDARLPDPVATRLLTALRAALAAASRRTGTTRVTVSIDATTTLPDGRPGVRLTVFDDGDGDAEAKTDRDDGPGTGTTVTWQSPLRTHP